MAKKTEEVADAPVSNEWPKWYFGPGGYGEIFENADDVPEGWVEHPADAPPAIDL